MEESDSRGLAADLAVVPLFAVGEVFLVGAFKLLHGTNVWSERDAEEEVRTHGLPAHCRQPEHHRLSRTETGARPVLYSD